MGELAQRLSKSATFLRERGFGAVDAAFVLGSGLSRSIELDRSVSVPFAEVPGFPAGRVVGHDHRVEFGHFAGRPCMAVRGRVHYYEGVDLASAVFPVRVARVMGAAWVALTNAAGSLHPDFEVGDVVALTDHLNLMGDTPLAGPNDDEVGTRFPDLSNAYDGALREHAETVAREAGLRLRRGIYAAVAGPQYETPAELRMLRSLGADLVGMSTVPETIAAVHSGLKVLALSVVTDLAFPEAVTPLDHASVVKAAQQAAPRVGTILEGVMRRSK